MGRAKQITSFIRRYDPELYCEGKDGMLCIYRKSQRIESYDFEGTVIHYVRPAPFFIFALTHDWSATGRPVDWGCLPILERLQQCDLHKRDMASEIERQEEKRTEEVARERANKTEDLFKDMRKTFAKATNDINTSTLKKTDLRKIKEKRSF